MIKLQNYTPKIYYEHSRDFQFIGRLYDMVLNSVKTNTDLIYSLPLSSDSDEKLLDLMMMTFGFQSKHNYNVKQLKALCASFAKVIRNKGNVQSIQDACNALVGAEGINESIYIDSDSLRNTLIMYVPQELSDTNLLRDLLNYILPAGMSFEMIKTLKTTRESTTDVKYNDVVNKVKKHSSWTSYIVDNVNSKVGINIPSDTPGAFENITIVDNIVKENK